MNSTDDSTGANKKRKYGDAVEEHQANAMTNKKRKLQTCNTQQLSAYLLPNHSMQLRKKTRNQSFLFGIPPIIVSKYFQDIRKTIGIIDVGIVNMGFVVISTSQRWDQTQIELVALINLTELDRALTPHTSNELTDRIDRFCTMYEQYVDTCHHILIERQPLKGHKAVEQLIFSKFREKAILISPNSMQAYMRISKRFGFDYDSRKNETVSIASRYISAYAKSPQVKEQYELLDRKHDIADAICIALFFIESKRLEYRNFVKVKK